MSYLSEELERQMKEQKVTGLQLAERTGISASQIYNWLNSVQLSISEEQLKLIQAALTNDHHTHARLVLAHLLDEKFGFGHDLVRIQMDEVTLSARPRKSARGEKAMQFLLEERQKNRSVNDLIIDLAICLGANLNDRRPTASSRPDASRSGNADTATEAFQQDYPPPKSP